MTRSSQKLNLRSRSIYCNPTHFYKLTKRDQKVVNLSKKLREQDSEIDYSDFKNTMQVTNRRRPYGGKKYLQFRFQEKEI
jgi:hypothetical protein